MNAFDFIQEIQGWIPLYVTFEGAVRSLLSDKDFGCRYVTSSLLRSRGGLKIWHPWDAGIALGMSENDTRVILMSTDTDYGFSRIKDLQFAQQVAVIRDKFFAIATGRS